MAKPKAIPDDRRESRDRGLVVNLVDRTTDDRGPEVEDVRKRDAYIAPREKKMPRPPRVLLAPESLGRLYLKDRSLYRRLMGD